MDERSALSHPPLAGTLLRASGLTAEQLARTFGVSVRTFRSWTLGEHVPEPQSDMLRELETLLDSLPVSSADERRSMLLESSHGPSLLREFEGRWASRVPRPQRIHYGVPVGERLGLGDDGTLRPFRRGDELFDEDPEPFVYRDGRRVAELDPNRNEIPLYSPRRVQRGLEDY